MKTSYNYLYPISFNLTYNVHICTRDYQPFRNNGYTAVMTHAETYGSTHTPNDTVNKMLAA